MPPLEMFSTENLDYLQRTGPKFTPSRLAPAEVWQASRCHVIQLRGVGRLDKSSASDTRQTALSDWQLTQLISEDLLIGLYGCGDPIAFLIEGEPGSVSLYIGIWQPQPGGGSVENTRTLAAILNGVYPGIELDEPADLSKVGKRKFSAAGLVLGVPTAKPPDLTDGAFAIDRLIRSLSETAWRALILAQPIPESDTRDARSHLIAEMRSMQSSAAAAGSPSPLAEHYNRLLSIALDEFTNAQAVGAWRTAIYLMSSEESFSRLGGAWKSVFSGAASLPEPMRVWPFPDALGLAEAWVMPSTPETKGPGAYHHPYKYQTMLSSSQLAAYIHLPQLETRGFTVKLVPGFDVVPSPAKSTSTISIGNVVDRTQPSNVPYLIPTNSLSGHVFVTGMTGAGKTNTVFHLLREALAQKINFLVIEPAKREYRALLDDDVIGQSLRVFTAGVEDEAPLRLNPFEVLRDSSLSVHLDLLRSVFSGSFGMWVPLPQVLEKCLVAIYQDRGWDVVTNKNPRLGDDNWDPQAFPTLSDLVCKVEEIVPTLGFDPEATGRILASLTSRLNGLRAGGKGRMLDVQQSFSMEDLLLHPTVLELEGMGDDDDKAFLIGILLIRLFEYRSKQGAKSIQHLLVIEEAHRLLANVVRNANQEQSDPRGKAVETFTNLLSEIRAYGQGIVIADQVPTRLAADVIKNTNLKIAHRIVSGDDREVLGQAMAMSNRQVAALSSLRTDRDRGVSQAVVFSGELDDAPILVEVKLCKRDPSKDVQSGDAVRKMAEATADVNTRRLLRQTPACEEGCGPKKADDECSVAASALEREPCRSAVARLVVSMMENPSTIDPLWKDVCAAISASRLPGMDENRIYRCLAVRAAAWLANRRRAQAGWSYQESRRFEAALRKVLLSVADGADRSRSLAAFQGAAFDLHARTYPPYRSCDAICTQGHSPLCLYRCGAADLLGKNAVKDVQDKITSSLAAEEPKAEDRANKAQAIWYEAQKAGFQLVAIPNEANTQEKASTRESSVRASLCFVQQLILQTPTLHPRTADYLLDRILDFSKARDVQ